MVLHKCVFQFQIAPSLSVFGKVPAFLAQPSSDGEKYALLSAGTVSVNHQQVVIQPTSKHVKCIYDTESFHLADSLCSTVGEGSVNTKKDIYDVNIVNRDGKCGSIGFLP